MSRCLPACSCALALAAASCAVPAQMVASPGDLAAYRSFRTASAEGARLARAQDYLDRYPNGAWASEVSHAFDTEEPAWFEAAQSSRDRARSYLIDLPRGPHAEAARALLLLFDQQEEDIDTLELLADARRTAAKLDFEAARRRRLGDVVLEEVAALLDSATWGARLDAPPPALAAVLRGAARRTWGGGARAWRTDYVSFVVPTPQGAEARGADVRLQLWLEGNRVATADIQGVELFARWAESIEMRLFDLAAPGDRALVAATVADVLGGALEAVLPAARCSTNPVDDSLILTRACDGWTVVARMATGPKPAHGAQGDRRRAPDGPATQDPAADDDMDTIEVRGPQQLDRAQPPGMR